MAAALGALGELGLGSVESAVGFGLGFALGRALGPLAVTIEQEAFSADPSRAVDPLTAAAIVAENVEAEAWGATEAAAGGINGEKFTAIVGELLNAPGVPELLTLWRRGEITLDDFTHGLRKAKLETRWDVPLEALKDVRLDPSVIALGIVRGLVADPGILPVGPPAGEGRVPKFPTFSVDALAEAAAHGVDKERLSVMVGNMGRPASPLEAAHAEWRGVIEHVDFLRAIAEGDVRNEWATAIFESARQILTPHEYQEAALRGVLPAAEADAGAAKHGMSADDAHLLFEIMGRPLAVHQITTGLARGGDYGGTYDDVPEPYRDAIRRSNIRPEYARLAHANRYSYPSAFVIRSLATGGEIDEPTTKSILLDIGWPPDLTDKVVAAWFGAATATSDKHVVKAQTQLWTALHKAYVDDQATDALATTTLAAAGVDAAAVPAVLALWQAERAIVRATLTATQIRKAIGQPGHDLAWATQRLEELGYSADDAATFLAE